MKAAKKTTTGRQELVVRALHTTQGEGLDVYAFFIKGGDIVQVADISRIERDAADELKGFQRPEIRQHVKGIVDYLNQGDVLFPNAIILALAPDVKFVASRGSKPAGDARVSESGTLTLPIYAEGGEFDRHLGYHLSPYVPLPRAETLAGKTNLIQIMLCPGYLRSLPGNTEAGYDPTTDNFTHAYCFTLSRYILKDPWILPFGWAAAGNRSMKLSEIAAIRPLSEAWAMADLDWEVPGDAKSLGIDRTPYVAKKPVHGNTRTALYFDLHVGKIRNQDWVKW